MNQGTVAIGPYRLDLGTGEIQRDGQGVELGQVERRLLIVLARHAPEVVGRDALVRTLWPEGLPPGSRALDQAWSRLRRRLGSTTSDALKTIRGQGLALVSTPTPTPPADPIAATLPARSTAFIGFHDELRAVEDWIHGREEGWLTVIGLGGAGKTRLAAEAARRVAATVDHMVWVDLAPQSDGVGPLLHVARRLGLDPAPGPELDAALGGILATREVLLFLDNLEHLPVASRRLGDVLVGCPQVRVVATSRRRLDVPGERLLRLRGLDPAVEAPALFAELLRQRWIAPDQHRELLDPAVVGEVCTATQGHPLSIELAVATLRRRPAEALLALLREAPTRLRGERSGRDARHATFEATFDYSWSLLDVRGQQALAALSLFAGRFARIDADALLDIGSSTLDALLDQSVVGGVDDLLTLHPLIRSAGRARLGALDVDGTIRARFRTRLLRWLAEQRQEICAESDPELAARVVSRMPDLSAAWHDAVAHGDVGLLASAWPAARTWIAYRDDFVLGADWCAAASTLGLAPDLRIDVLATLGHCLVPLGEAARAVRLLSAACADEEGEGASWIRLYLALAGAHARLGAFDLADEALAAARRAERLATGVDDDLRAWLHLGQGMRLRAAGQSHLTGPDGEAALRCARRAGNRPLLRRALVLRGSFLVASSRFSEALEHAVEAGQLAEAAHDRQGLCSALNIRALALRYLGQLEEALEVFLRTREMLTVRGAVANLPYTCNQIANLKLELGRLEAAEEEAERALELALERGDRKDTSFSLLTLATVHLAAGRHQAGLTVAERRRAFEAESGSENTASVCMTGLVLTLLAHFDGQHARAEAELEHMRASYAGSPSYIQLQFALASSLVHARAGRIEPAVRWATTALELANAAGSASLQRSLYPLVLTLAILGDTSTAAAARDVLDACPPTVERWIHAGSIDALAGEGTAERCCTLADVTERVSRSLQVLMSDQ